MDRPSTARLWIRRALATAGLALLALSALIGVRLVADDGDAGAPEVSDRGGATVEELSIDSDAVGSRQAVNVVVPETEAEHPPLLIFLHGRGGDEDSELSQEFFDALARAGERAPIVAFPDGGDSSYWHDRDSGNWGTYVTREVIPQVADEFDADRDRVAIGGISMGGYGAYQLAGDHPGRFCAVGGHSPAIWQSADETADGAFDDAEDFADHDVIATAAADPSMFAERPVWLDAGDQDPFLAGDNAFVSELEDAGASIQVSHPPGGHDADYWRSRWVDYMRFYAGALARCDT